MTDEFDVTMDDGATVRVNRWLPEGEAHAAVQITHGMAEHSLRYSRLAEVLVDHGYAVWAHDHRGHGQSASSDLDLGHFADSHGFDRLVEDLLAVRQYIATHEPAGDGKVCLFAHSMGTFVAQAALAFEPPARWDAVILAGSDAPRGKGVWALLQVAAFERRRKGKRGRSGLVDHLAFGPYNAAFKPTRTKSDWLSRDPSEVDKFEGDRLTGFRLTNQSWVDFLDARLRVGREGFAQASPKDLPVLLLAGDRDPVGRSGVGVRQLEEQLQSAGMTDCEAKLYPGARHELLNELNRDEVHVDVLNFLKRALR